MEDQMRFFRKNRRLIAGLGVLVMIMGLVTPLSPVRADDVPTTAVVTPGSTPPVIEWAWALPDMNSTIAGIQYGTGADAHQHDDDMNLSPINPPSTNHMFQVTPNLEDEPEKRLIEYWVAVQDIAGIDDIIDAFIKVLHPDGSLKYQLHGTANFGPPTAANPLVPVACTALGNETAVGTPIEAAVHTGQMTSQEAFTIVDQCLKHQKLIFRMVGEISKHQPAGEYNVQNYGVDKAGSTGNLSYAFDVLPVVGLRIDFNKVDFGTIIPNTAKWIPGDLNFSPPNDTKPTVKNVGNVPMTLSLLFSKMIGQNQQKEIIEFDAQLDAEQIPVINAGIPVTFTHTLGSNVLGQLDLSIHPGSIPADNYLGLLTLIGIF
jgi:hypothetical protein